MHSHHVANPPLMIPRWHTILNGALVRNVSGLQDWCPCRFTARPLEPKLLKLVHTSSAAQAPSSRNCSSLLERQKMHGECTGSYRQRIRITLWRNRNTVKGRGYRQSSMPTSS